MNKISKLIQSNPQYEGYNYIKIKTLEKNSIKYNLEEAQLKQASPTRVHPL